MATQIVTIVIRQVGAQAAAGAINAVGRQSRAAAASVRVFTAALGAIATAGAITGLAGIQDSYIRLTNQLRFATDSQEEFQTVLRAVLNVANETRAPIEDTALLYRRLRAATRAFGVSQQEALDVVKGLNAAILISGANAQEAKGGLIQFTQALQSGRLAGDELRSLLENITPLAEAVSRNLGFQTLGAFREAAKNIPVQELFRGVQQATAEFAAQLGDVRFSASQTFNVFSNNLKIALSVLDEAVGATDGFNKIILEASENLDLKLAGAIASVLRGFGSLFRTLADLSEELNNLGVRQLPTFSQSFRAALLAIQLFLKGALQVTLVLSTAVAGLVSGFLNVVKVTQNLAKNSAFARGALGPLGNLLAQLPNLVDESTVNQSEEIFVNLAEAVGRTNASIGESSGQFAALTTEIQASAPTTAGMADNLRLLADGADVTAVSLEKAVLAARNFKETDLTKKGEAVTPPPTQQELNKINRANQAVLRILSNLLAAEQKRIDPLNAQLEKIIQQRQQLERLAKITGETDNVRKARLISEGQVVAIQTEQAENGLRIADLTGEIASNIDEIRTFAPDIADQLTAAADAAVDLADGSKEAGDDLERVAKETRDFLKERQGLVRQLGESIVSGGLGPFADQLRGVLEGEAFNFGEALAAAGSNIFASSMQTVIDDLATQFGQLFQKQFGTDIFGGAGFGAALGIGIGLLGSAFKDTSENISTGLARSVAVENAQATRGVVAGPTNVPIFQVGESIEAAFLPTNALLAQIRDGVFALAGIAPPQGEFTDSATSELQRTTPALA